MLSPETLSAAASPARAHHLHRRAYTLVDNVDGETLVLNALVVPRADRRKGWGSRLLRALEATFPDRVWYVPEIVPENLARAFFLELGWKVRPLKQLEMRLELPDGAIGAERAPNGPRIPRYETRRVGADLYRAREWESTRTPSSGAKPSAS